MTSHQNCTDDDGVCQKVYGRESVYNAQLSVNNSFVCDLPIDDKVHKTITLGGAV